MTNSKRHLATLAAGFGMVIVIAGCGANDLDPASGSAGGTTVVATTSIWGDIVRQVLCDADDIELVTLMPPNADPHSFEPSLEDRATVEGATIVVSNGLGLEESLDSLLDTVRQSGTPLFEAGEHVDAISYDKDDDKDHDEDDHGDEDEHGDEDHNEDEHGDEDHNEDEHGDEDHDEDEHAHAHGHGSLDPHIWFDPTRVADALEPMTAAFADAGLDRATTESCIADYTEELLALDAEVSATLADIPDQNRELVTNHDSLTYFSDRYDFEVIGTVLPSISGTAETNPKQLEELANVIAEHEVPAIFVDAEHGSDAAETLASRLSEETSRDISVVVLNSGGLGVGDRATNSYVEFMRYNTELIASSLAG